MTGARPGRSRGPRPEIATFGTCGTAESFFPFCLSVTIGMLSFFGGL